MQLAIIAAYFQRINALRQEIEAFEQRFDCRSEDFVARYERGEIEETMDTIRWVFRYEAYQRELEWQRSC